VDQEIQWQDIIKSEFMINNDVLRRVRYALDLNDQTMIDIFALNDVTISRDVLLNLLKKDNQEGYVALDNQQMDAFLKGLITHRRGKLETNPEQPKKPDLPLTNNSILKKLKIALDFKEEDMLNTLKLADFKISKGELSAFFRLKGHKNYRECGDQIIRNFLQGLTIHFRKPVE
jgi:uncharacterized protein YehS (DUF1456 family)